MLTKHVFVHHRNHAKGSHRDNGRLSSSFGATFFLQRQEMKLVGAIALYSMISKATLNRDRGRFLLKTAEWVGKQ
jgi:hypothetical protein